MLTPEGCAARRKRLWDALPEPVRRPDPGRPAEPDLLRQLRPVAVRLPDERRRRRPDPGARPGDARGRLDGQAVPRPGARRRGRRPGLVRRQALGPAPQGAARPDGASTCLAKVDGLAVRDRVGRRARGDRGADPRASRRSSTWLALDDIVRGLRRAKDPDEVALIRRSVQAGEAGHAAALARIKPGMTELDAYLLVQQAATEAAGEQVDRLRRLRLRPPLRDRARRPADAPEDRAGRPVPARLLGGRPRLPGRLHQHVRRRRPAHARPARLFEACVEALAAGEAALKPGVPGARGRRGRARAIAASVGLGHAYLVAHRPRARPEPPRAALLRPRERRHGRRRRRRRHRAGPVRRRASAACGSSTITWSRADGFETLTHHRITLEP